MAAILDPEVQLAQRLASNEKPVRTRAMKKLRKYVSARSHGQAGGFSSEELQKLWKGLFYCLWMQDKPLLQEELSTRISALMDSFHGLDAQLLYLDGFLLTLSREWTGIDRLRLDKFYQLTRFMFRQTFAVLQRTGWDSRAAASFLELLHTRLLQGGAAAPSGLQLHVLDLYLPELAATGSTQLTAEQNLMFIEPFCRTAAKTKNLTLFRAICTNIFSTIIDQAPFAIQDLMREVKAAEAGDSDSGHSSDGPEQETRSRGSNRKQQINGKTSHEEEDSDDNDDLLHLEDSDAEPLDEDEDDDDVGPVLQFDYGAVADKLLELASRTSTPGTNRHKLYKIIKVLRDLSEGIFPQDDYPEEVSTDEDDDMFGSRRRMKRRRPAEDEEAHTEKKKKANTGPKENQSTKPADKEKKKKTNKKAKGNHDNQDQGQTEPTQEGGEDVRPQTSTPSPDQKAADADPSETPVGTAEDRSKKRKRRRRRKNKEVTAVSCEPSSGPGPDPADGPAGPGPDPAEGPAGPGPDPGKENMSTSERKKKKKSVKAVSCDPAEGEEGCGPDDITSVTSQTTVADQKDPTAPDQKDPAPTKKSVVTTPTPEASPRKKKKKSVNDEAEEAEVPQAAPTKKRKSATAAQLQEAADKSPERPSLQGEMDASSGKPARKRKIPIEFEYEADELEATPPSSGTTEEHTLAGASGPSVPLNSTLLLNEKKKKKKKKSGGPDCDIISFRNKTLVPTPLFCRTKAGPGPSAHSKEQQQAGRSELKKVTFGLKNNRTAEFRRTDRSLLLSPDGSSRVPFDPQQKPKFGVLKSPPSTPSPAARKTRKTRKTRGPGPQRSCSTRPRAADFF